MQKWFILTLVTMLVVGAQAAEKGKGKHAGAAPMTKESFMEAEQKAVEATGQTFDKSKAEATFAAKDKNADGVLTADEFGGVKGKGKGKNKK